MVTGNISNVFDHSHGSELAADAAAAATTITVVDVELDFNLDAGGQLKIDDDTNSEILSYTVPSGSTGTINLGSALANSYLTGTRVTVYPEVIERWADIVEEDGEEALRCLVPHQLRPLIPLGPRNPDDGTAEHVRCEFEEGDLVVRNVLGEPATGLDLQASDDSEPDDSERIRWTRTTDGLLVAAIWGYTNAGDGLTEAVYERGDAGAQMQLLVVPKAGGPAVGFILQAFAGLTTRDQYAQVRVPDGVGGVITKMVLRGDGTSDFLFDNDWANWTPSLTGWSADPTNAVYRYKQEGKKVTVQIAQGTAGTSNAATKTISLPVTAKTLTNARWEGFARAVDNGVTLATSSFASITSGGTTVAFGKDLSAVGGWTASGSHRIISAQLMYEAA